MKRIEPNAKRIRKLMRGNQPAIAKQMGIATSSLSRKINSNQRIYLDEINTLAQLIGVDPLSLLMTIETE